MASPLAIPATSLSPERAGAADASAPRAIDQPRCGDHLRKNHCDSLEGLDLNILVAARVGVLNGKNADRAFQPDDRNSREAVEMFLARLRPVGKGRVLGGFSKVEDPAFGCDRADEAFAHPEPGHVHRFLAEAMSRE